MRILVLMLCILIKNISASQDKSINIADDHVKSKHILSNKGEYYIGNIDDSRIKYAVWNRNTVYDLKCIFDQITTIAFSDEEVVERIVMNDQTQWLVEHVDNELYLKPKNKQSSDILHVVTNKRKYVFQIFVDDNITNKDPSAVIIMQFIYPGTDDIFVQVQEEDSITDDIPEIKEVEKYNFNYMILNAHHDIHPLRIVDDGISTYFYFSEKQEIPAFFAINKFGDEVSVNSRRSAVHSNVVIVNGVYKDFILRAGKGVKLLIRNDGFLKESVVHCKK